MKINKYQDIKTAENDKRKAFIDKHSAFVHCDKEAKKGEKFKVKVKVGDEVSHPDDPDHYIAWVQLWDGERMLAETTMIEGTLGNESNQLEIDYYIVPKENMKLTAMAFCTLHGLWQSDEVEVEVK